MKVNNLISYYKEKLKKNIFFKNVAIVAGGNTVAKLLGIISTPIITRMYAPDDFGIFYVFLSFVGIAGSLSTLRYAITIPLAKDEKMANNILKLCFVITLTLSVLMLIGIGLFGNFFTQIFSVQKLTPYLWFIPIVFLGQGVYEALNNWAVRNKEFKLITRTQITQNISSSVIKIGFGALQVVPLGLFYGQVAMVYSGIGSLFLKLKKKNTAFFNDFSWLEIKFVAIRYKRFPLIQSWSQLLLALGAQLPVLLIGAFYGAKVVGVFGLALGMIALPMNLIGQAVSQVYYAEISKYGKSEPEKIYNLSISIIKKMFGVALVPIGIIILFGPNLFSFVFGAQWYEAGVYAQILSPIILFRFISSPIMNVLNVLEKQGFQLILNVIRVVLILIVFYLSYGFELTQYNALILYSISISLFYFFLISKILSFIKNNVDKNERIY